MNIFCLLPIYYRSVFLMVIFYFSNFSAFRNWIFFFCREELALLHLFMYLFNCLFHYGLKDIYFECMDHAPILSVFLLLIRFHLGHWVFLQVALVLSACSHHFLSISVVSSTTRFFRIILYFFCLSPGINQFFKEPLC